MISVYSTMANHDCIIGVVSVSIGTCHVSCCIYQKMPFKLLANGVGYVHLNGTLIWVIIFVVIRHLKQTLH